MPDPKPTPVTTHPRSMFEVRFETRGVPAFKGGTTLTVIAVDVPTAIAKAEAMIKATGLPAWDGGERWVADVHFLGTEDETPKECHENHRRELGQRPQ